jgi:superfamily II DNA or RNA helicase
LLNEQFNKYIVQVVISELKAGKNALLVTNSKAHQGPLLVQLFKKHGYDVPFVTGDETKKNRKNFRQDFRDGKINCLLGTIYKEGVDFPKCDCGVLCDGGYDEKATIQFLGRILRISKGKGIAHLIDFFHRDHKYLQKHSQARLSYYVCEDLDKIKIHKTS